MPLLGKWMWRFSLEEDSLWAKDIRSIHGLRPNGWDTKVEEQNVPKKSKEMYEQSLLSFQEDISIEVGISKRQFLAR